MSGLPAGSAISFTTSATPPARSVTVPALPPPFCSRSPSASAPPPRSIPWSVAAEIVSGSYFPVLGVGPALGRVIEPEDDAVPGAGPVVVLSYDFWQAQFGGAADIVGRKVLIGNRPMTVAGVAAAGFRGVDVGFVPAFWIPTSMYADANFGTDEDLFNGPERWLQILARLRPGVSAAQAQAGLVPWFR